MMKNNKIILLLISIPLILGMFYWPGPKEHASKVEPLTLNITKAPLPIKNETKTTPIKSSKWHNETVKNGDNLANIFKRLSIPQRDLQTILALGKETESLKSIYPNDVLSFELDDNTLKTLKFDINATEQLVVELSTDIAKSHIITHNIETKQRFAHGVIRSSLFIAGQKAGLSDRLIMQLAEIFGWDIDFVLDIRPNDSFSVIYEEIYKNGKPLKTGNILAAQFINRGKTYTAVHYNNGNKNNSYYSETGKNLRKSFLRTPVEFTRISSKFSLNRKHPIFKTRRPHRGVDYAAPRGTPIIATGDGKIKHRGKKGGYGNTVIIEHAGKYSTLYAHLSKFAKNTKKGSRVKQGQIIGYVGSTGYATGPHLHYEFRVNNIHRNPLTVDLPDAPGLSSEQFLAFKTASWALLGQLKLSHSIAVAQNYLNESKATKYLAMLE